MILLYCLLTEGRLQSLQRLLLSSFPALVSHRYFPAFFPGQQLCQLNGALCLDMSLMRGVIVDPERKTALVQGGARSRDVNIECSIYNLNLSMCMLSETKNKMRACLILPPSAFRSANYSILFR